MYSVLSAFIFPRYLVSCPDCSDPDSCGSGKAMEEGGEEPPQKNSGNLQRRFDPFANLGDSEDADLYLTVPETLSLHRGASAV